MSLLGELLQGKELFAINSGSSIKVCVGFMAGKGVGLLPVMQGNKLIGVFSERDLVNRVIAKNRDLNEIIVDEVMSTNLVTANIDESHEEAFARMQQAKIRHILIMDGEDLAGVLSMGDLLETDLLSCKSTVEVLNNYIYSR
ncbi:MAG: CBS domain-containing protein [Ignavibacteriaceae bacterium]